MQPSSVSELCAGRNHRVCLSNTKITNRVSRTVLAEPVECLFLLTSGSQFHAAGPGPVTGSRHGNWECLPSYVETASSGRDSGAREACWQNGFSSSKAIHNSITFFRILEYWWCSWFSHYLVCLIFIIDKNKQIGKNWEVENFFPKFCFWPLLAIFRMWLHIDNDVSKITKMDVKACYAIW